MCAQAGAHLSESLSAVVLDGGIADFFQATLCQLSPDLQRAYASNRTAFDAIMAQAATASPSLNAMLGWAEVGLNVSTFGALLDAFQPYFLRADEVASLAAVPLFINNPQFDTATGHQSRLLWSQLRASGATMPAQSMLFTPDVASGVALHCGVGSTFSNNINVLTWLLGVFPPL